MRYSVCLLFFILFALRVNVYSQRVAAFSTDHEDAILEMQDYIEKINNKRLRKEIMPLVETLVSHWQEGIIPDTVKDDVIHNANMMLDRKLKNYPHLYLYLRDIDLMIGKNIPARAYYIWNHTYDSLLSNRKRMKPIEKFLRFSLGFFEENALYKSRFVTWKVDDSPYTFIQDSTMKIVFEKVKLTCYAHKDSSVIYNTYGVYSPLDKKFYGRGGKLLWTRAGFAPDTVYAELGAYVISTNLATFHVDTVNFYHKRYWDYPLLGSLTEKVKANSSVEKATFPRFHSFEAVHKIDSLFRDISYRGGIEIRGSKMLGKGTEDQLAEVKVFSGDSLFIDIKSKNYLIRKDRLAASSASVTIKIGNDSIYHPAIRMNYVDKGHEFSFVRLGKGVAQSPFINTLQKVNMYTEAIHWTQDSSEMKFEMTKGITGRSQALFESQNFFSEDRFYKLQGLDKQNPLLMLSKYTAERGDREIAIQQLVEYTGYPANQLILLMLNLAKHGFVVYNPDTRMVLVKDKTFHYIDSFNKKTDYDVLQFNSETYGNANAVLSLDSLSLHLFGVPVVALSDSQKVFVYPAGKELYLNPNRDFDFSGRVSAGRFDYYTKNSKFSYDRFKFDMPTIDSMEFSVKSFDSDSTGIERDVKVKNVLSDISGVLLIDDPNNKSGIKDIKGYPIFTSEKESFVYYDSPDIYNGVYSRDHFFFYVYPFTVDSLDDFVTSSMKFKGYLSSGGMLPDIEETLSVQEDYSLGFSSKTPPEGYPVYDSLGTLFGEISLSNKGMRAGGSIAYLTSTSWADTIFMFPDSANAMAKNILIREQLKPVEYPKVSGAMVQEHWEPYNDNLFMKSTGSPFDMFNNRVTLKGVLNYTSEDLQGSGLLTIGDAELTSNLFHFKQHELAADTADFRLKSMDKTRISFATHNYKAYVDIDKREGEFISNGGASVADFPVNQYIATIDRFGWKMDDYIIQMGYAEKMEAMKKLNDMPPKEVLSEKLEGTEFVSVRPGQDSLRFISTLANFNMKSNVIDALDVKYIRVADAAIFPSDHRVAIYKDARIDKFKNAKIIANTDTKYHEIYDAEVEILGRNKYKAKGKYDYVDMTGYKQEIKLPEIAVDNNLQTYAIGKIDRREGFMLSPNFDYFGDVLLQADKEGLIFDGAFRIRHTCSVDARKWVKFKSEVVPDNIMIAITDSLFSTENDTLLSALMFSESEFRFYSGFLEKKRDSADRVVMAAKGFLTFDNSMEEYQIAPKERFEKTSKKGNRLRLARRTCNLRGDGELDLGLDLGSHVNLKTDGSFDLSMRSDSISFNVVQAIDFPLDKKLWDFIIEDIKDLNLSGAPVNRPEFVKAVTDWVEGKKSEHLISDIQLFNRLRKVPSELDFSILFSDIRFYWNPNTRSYISRGLIGLGAIGKTAIGKYANGYIELGKRRTGDVVNIYLEFDGGKYWYYFNYRNNLLQTISSNPDYNALLNETPEKKRTVKGKGKDNNYIYSISTLEKKTDFQRRMKFQ